MSKYIDNIHGTVFSPTMVYAGYIFLVLGLFAFTGDWVVGLILTTLSIFISFSYNGIELNLDKKKYKEYSIYFGITTGKWISLGKYVYVTVLCNKEVSETHSRANVTTSDSQNYFDVYMLDKSHREKLLIKRHKFAGAAMDYAKKLSTDFKFELTKYNPVLSTETKRKRYRR